MKENMRIYVDLTMELKKDFKEIVSELKSQHFTLDRYGYLTYNSPFINPGDTNKLMFKFKPLTEGSTIYTVNLEGQLDNISSVLSNTFRTYDIQMRMINFNLTLDDYSQEKYRKLVMDNTDWKQTDYDPNIFNLPHHDASCLLICSHISFMTRALKTFKDVNDFISICEKHVKVFRPELEFNLFTYENYEF